jgi:hypothetical protein
MKEELEKLKNMTQEELDKYLIGRFKHTTKE